MNQTECKPVEAVDREDKLLDLLKTQTSETMEHLQVMLEESPVRALFLIETYARNQREILAQVAEPEGVNKEEEGETMGGFMHEILGMYRELMEPGGLLAPKPPVDINWCDVDNFTRPEKGGGSSHE